MRVDPDGTTHRGCAATAGVAFRLHAGRAPAACVFLEHAPATGPGSGGPTPTAAWRPRPPSPRAPLTELGLAPRGRRPGLRHRRERQGRGRCRPVVARLRRSRGARSRPPRRARADRVGWAGGDPAARVGPVRPARRHDQGQGAEDRPGTCLRGARRRAGRAGTAAGRAPHPALAAAGRSGALVAGEPRTTRWRPRRYCSVPRNDPRNQALQPRPRQVEWAVDQAITGTLYAGRPANWKNLGMPAYSPQGAVPAGRRCSAAAGCRRRSMLGILAQESNLWQAARFAVPGVTGEPADRQLLRPRHLQRRHRPTTGTSTGPRPTAATASAQVTDGMRKAGHEKAGETAAAVRQAAGGGAGLRRQHRRRPADPADQVERDPRRRH